MADSPSDVKAVPSDKADLILQASWEIDAIARMVHEYLPIEPRALAYRALMRRCMRLTSMVMSAIGETDFDASTLQSMLDDEEVAHA